MRKIMGLLGLSLMICTIIINNGFAWTGSGLGASNPGVNSVAVAGNGSNWSSPGKTATTGSSSTDTWTNIGNYISYKAVDIPVINTYFADQRKPAILIEEAQNAAIDIDQRIYDLTSAGIAITQTEWVADGRFIDPLLSLLQTDTSTLGRDKSRELKTTALDTLVTAMPSNETLVRGLAFIEETMLERAPNITVASKKVFETINTLSGLATRETDTELKSAYKDTLIKIYSKCTNYDPADWETIPSRAITDKLIANVVSWSENGGQIKTNVNSNLTDEAKVILAPVYTSEYKG